MHKRYMLRVYPASVRAPGCSLCEKAYIRDQVGIRLVAVGVIFFKKKRLIPKENRLPHVIGSSSSLLRVELFLSLS